MMLTLLIARHGNTFDPGETVLRVGKRTDLPLSHSGREQAKKLGDFLRDNYPNISQVFVSSLRRTQETAAIALPDIPFEINPMFDEIDYGVDDGKPESEVIARIGHEALERWEQASIPPDDWVLDTQKIVQNWQEFAKQFVDSAHAMPALAEVKAQPAPSVILVVTSHGIARFAPNIISASQFESKMHTGAISALTYIEDFWKIEYWNLRPGE